MLIYLLAITGCHASPDQPDLVFGKRGLQPGDFIRPRVITLGKDELGNDAVYIVDYAGRIQVFNIDGKPLRLWSTPTIAHGRPAGLGWSEKKNLLLVADSHYQQILLYEPDGKLVQKIPGTWGEGHLGPFEYVADIVEDEEGFWYISEFGNESQDRIRKLDPQGNHVTSFGSHGSQSGEMSRPRGLAIFQNELYVADSCNHRIQVFTLDGIYIRSIGNQQGDGLFLQYPYDVAVRSDGTLFVAEWGQNRIHKFSQDGKSLGTWGKPGRDTGCLFQPWGVACTSSKIFILDSENHRVQRVAW